MKHSVEEKYKEMVTNTQINAQNSTKHPKGIIQSVDSPEMFLVHILKSLQKIMRKLSEKLCFVFSVCLVETVH